MASKGKFTFSIAGLIGLVIFSAIAIAALRQATEVWDAGLFTLTLTALTLSILMAIHRAGLRRAFWTGFAICGSAYLLVSLVPTINSRLLTSKFLAYVDSKMADRPDLYTVVLAAPSGGNASTVTKLPIDIPTVGGSMISTGSTTLTFSSNTSQAMAFSLSGSSERFVSIGHSILALLVAWVGGRFSMRLLLARALEAPVEPERATPLPSDLLSGGTAS